MQNIAERYTGASVRRSEDPRILTGTGHYVDDVRLPGMLHAAFVRSTVAHARVTRVDVSEARRAPGVVLVLTGEELESMVVSGPGIAAMFAGGGADAHLQHPRHGQGAPRRRSRCPCRGGESLPGRGRL